MLRLSAIGDAGNARVLPLARSVAWTESKRSVALASAAVGAPEGERPPTSGRFRARKRLQMATSGAMRGHWMDGAFRRSASLRSFRAMAAFLMASWWRAKTRTPMRREDTSSLRAQAKQSKNRGPPARNKVSRHAEIAPA